MPKRIVFLLFLSFCRTTQGWIPVAGLSRMVPSIPLSGCGALPSTLSNTDSLRTNPVIFVKSEHNTNQWISPQSPPRGAEETWRWCKNFVMPLNLCPWAAASVRSDGALKIYHVDQVQDMQSAVADASKDLTEAIIAGNLDANVAISFVVTTAYWDFGSFYSWFLDLEEASFDDCSYDVTLAPFHPDWIFQGDDPILAFEKRAPYPTITLVSRAVIDKAGNAVTEAIAGHNEQVLMGQGFDQLNELYQQQVKLPPV